MVRRSRQCEFDERGVGAASSEVKGVSDLGIPEAGLFEGRPIDSKLATVMNAVFLGQGIMMVLAAVLLYWSLPRLRNRGLFLTLAVLYAFGIALVGLVHGSAANEATGLLFFHGLGAMFAILCGNALLILAGISTFRPLLGVPFSRLSIALGCIGLIAVVVHMVTKSAGVVNGLGLSERASVYTIVGWQMMIAVKFMLLDRRR